MTIKQTPHFIYWKFVLMSSLLDTMWDNVAILLIFPKWPCLKSDVKIKLTQLRKWWNMRKRVTITVVRRICHISYLYISSHKHNQHGWCLGTTTWFLVSTNERLNEIQLHGSKRCYHLGCHVADVHCSNAKIDNEFQSFWLLTMARAPENIYD